MMRSFSQRRRFARKALNVTGAMLCVTAAVLLFAACGDSHGPAADGPTVDGPAAEASVPPSEVGSTPRARGVTPPATRFVPGTVALFDIRKGTAQSLDMHTAVVRAMWIDAGETVLAFDAYSAKYVAMKLDGTLVQEIADERVTTGYEPMPLIYPVSVNDGHSVTVNDWEAMSLTLMDIRDGSRMTLRDHAMTGGEFSPGGAWLAGAAMPIGSDGHADPARWQGGVFARKGRCHDDTPYACLEWELPQPTESGPSFFFVSQQTWSPDGKHLLMERRSNCPDPTPGSRDSTPCTPEATFEVYAWPSHKLVLTIPSGEARWSGSGRIQVRGGGDPAFSSRSGFFVDLDGSKSPAPEVFAGCCGSYSPDGRYAILSLVPGEDCSLVEVSSGSTVASVSAGPGDTNDTGICQVVSWTRDGSMAIASGVALAAVLPTPPSSP